MPTLKRIATAFAAIAALSGSADIPAQSFPAKPVRVISVFPTGISPDTAMRVVADKLSRTWNQPVVVEPKPGANGFIAIGAVKQAPADGHTLLLVSNANTSINPHLFPAAPYDPEKDFAPVSTVYRAPFFLAVSASGPYQTVPQLIAAARANPERVSYSTPYMGSPPHLGGASLAHLTETRMLAVHFKESAQLYSSIASGDVVFSMATLGSLTPLAKAGKLKLLAIAAPSRLPDEPGIPTLAEAGGPRDLRVESWVGVLAPRGTPPEVANRISDAIARALDDAAVTERFRAQGLVPTAATPAEMAQLIRDDGRKYGELIKRIGLKAE